MLHRIPNVMGILSVSMLAHPVWTDRIAHAQEQTSSTLLNSDAKLLVEIAFWQSIEDSEDVRDFKDYLEKFPDGQFVALAHRRLAHAKVAARGRALLNEYGRKAMIYAVRESNRDVLDWLTAQGADVNARGGFDRTPMHEAAQTNAVDAMKWLKAHMGPTSTHVITSDELRWATRRGPMLWMR